MITPNETMLIIIGVLFLSFSFTTYSTYLLTKEIKKLRYFAEKTKGVENDN